MPKLINSKIKPDIVWRMHTNGYCATLDGEPINITETFADCEETRWLMINEGRKLFGWDPIDRTEFKVGQFVTFQPYEDNDSVPAVVAEVGCDGLTFTENDTRIFYRLTGRYANNRLKSICTGKSIKESIYYAPVPVKELFKS